MKKIGKKLSYYVKLFLAFSLLFNSVSPFATVLAEENMPSGDAGEVEVTPGDDKGDVTNLNEGAGETGEKDGEEKTDGEGTDGSGTEGSEVQVGEGAPTDGEEDGEGTLTDGNETTLGEGGDDKTPEALGDEGTPAAGDETTPSGEGTTPEGEAGGEGETAPEEALVFAVEVSGNNAVIKYSKANELSSDTKLRITEDFKYLDNEMHGAVNNEIELTDEIKASLAGSGYTYESTILADNVYDGEYTVTATVGEDSETATKKIESESGVTFELYNNDDLVYEKTDGKYVVPVGEQGLMVRVKVLPGGLSPNDTFEFEGGTAPLADAINGIVVKNIYFIDYLKGEFSDSSSVTVAGQQYDETFTIMYGEYQDNTDGLNEAASVNVLDNTYMFFGDSAAGSLYITGEGKLEELETIVEDFIVESKVISYTVTEKDDGYVVTLIDEHGVEIEYIAPKPTEADEKVDASLEIENASVSVGDEFTVSYVVTLKELMVNGVSGVISYDKDLLELSNVVANKFAGSANDDKFLYAGTEGLTGTETEDEDGNKVLNEEEYVILTLTFKALSAGSATISVNDSKFYNQNIYYESKDEIKTEVTINEASEEPSDDDPSEEETEASSLSSLTIGGQAIELVDGKFDYEITVPEDTKTIDVDAIVAGEGYKITSMVYPEELVDGENTVTITVEDENGKTQTYTVKVIRGTVSNDEEDNSNTDEYVTYADDTYTDGGNNNSGNDNKIDDGGKKDDNKDNTDDNTKTKDKGKLQRMVIILLILLVIAGLIYLIFKDDNDDDETKKANKDINKFKNDDDLYSNTNKKNNNRNNKNNNKNNNKKGR